MTYKKLWESDNYTTGIYDNCDAAIYIRADGQRARVEMDTVKWRENTGGYHRQITYIKGRDIVRALVRRLRELQIEALRLGLGRHNSYIIQQLNNY